MEYSVGRLMRAEDRAPFTTPATSASCVSHCCAKIPWKKEAKHDRPGSANHAEEDTRGTGHTASMSKKQKVMGIGAQFASSFMFSAGPPACEMVLPTVTVGLSASVYLT